MPEHPGLTAVPRQLAFPLFSTSHPHFPLSRGFFFSLLLLTAILSRIWNCSTEISACAGGAMESPSGRRDVGMLQWDGREGAPDPFQRVLLYWEVTDGIQGDRSTPW